MAIAREAAKQERLAAAEFNRQQKEAERQEKARLRELAAIERRNLMDEREAARQAKAQYLLDRQEEAELQNEEINNRIARLDFLLEATLKTNDRIEFSSLRIQDEVPQLRISESLRAPTPEPEPREEVLRPSGLRALLPGTTKRYRKAVRSYEDDYNRRLEEWHRNEQQRLQKLTDLELYHKAQVAAFQSKKEQRDKEINEFEYEYRSGNPDAVVSYYSMVLEKSSYPHGFPQKFSIAYVCSSKQLVVEYELPDSSIVPDVCEYRYVKTKDEIAKKIRKSSDIKNIYQEVVASIALRTIHEIFEADQNDLVTVVCFNGYVRSVDLATGKDIAPHLISVRTTKDRFTDIDLSRIDKKICLKNLGAQVSRRPEEAQAVKPIVEFEMADSRFIDQNDLVSDLYSATNLMDLNPYEFEQLVANLFGQMGLESKLTRSSRDGGVDCVAFDKRPVLGGKVVIQAKRYRHTVGVSAVRDLYGTMMNEGANKGILVTTSGYGPDAYEFASDKPIELMEGSGLLFLLQEIGIQARIVFPEQ